MSGVLFVSFITHNNQTTSEVQGISHLQVGRKQRRNNVVASFEIETTVTIFKRLDRSRLFACLAIGASAVAVQPLGSRTLVHAVTRAAQT